MKQKQSISELLIPKKRGRPPLSDEQKKTPKGSKNITVDADILALLEDAKRELFDRFHFEPTISQVLRYVITEAALRKETTR